MFCYIYDYTFCRQLHRINTYYYEGDNLNIEDKTKNGTLKALSILKALSRILISTIAGFIAYIFLYSNTLETLPLDLSKLSIDVENPTSKNHDFLIVLFAFIAGFSEKLIPDIMLSYEKSTKKPKTQNTIAQKDMSQQ